MSLTKLLIRDYDNIRQILRDIYFFGCFSRDDFVRKGISGRKYDNEQRRISAYLPQKFVKKRRVNKKVLLYCTYRLEDSGKNYLAETYRNKSFTMLDIMAYFFVQQILSSGRQMTLQEILDEIPNYNDAIEFTKDNLRVKLEELVENGLLIQKRSGKSVKYELSEDIWKDFETEELVDIYYYLDCLKNTSPLEMPYYFLQNRLELYLEADRKMVLSGYAPFQYKHNHLFNVLDNDVLLEMLKAITNQKFLKISREYMGEKTACITVPIEIIHDSTYGRQYLLCYNQEMKQMSVVRVDRVLAADCMEDVPEDLKKIIQEKKEAAVSCWCVSGINMDLQTVEIEFRFHEEKEAFILTRLQREGHGGSIKRIDKNLFQYVIQVKDPQEMIPWIRSFGERAKVIRSGEAGIENKISQDWKKAVEKYEALS